MGKTAPTPSPKKIPSIYAFIDGENIRNSISSLSNGYSDLDYTALYDYLTTKKGVTKIYIYVGIEQGDTAKEQKFEDLRKLGYFVYAKEVQAYKQQPYYKGIDCPDCHHHFVQRIDRPDKKKANCDADLTLDAVRHGCLNEFDEMIAFTGDGDFARVFEHIAKDMGKKVTVYSTMNKRTHTKLKNLAKSGVIKMEDLAGMLSDYGEKFNVTIT